MPGLSYVVSFVNQMSRPAHQAAQSVSTLTSTVKAARTELAGYQRQLSLAKDLGDIAGHQKYSALVRGAKEREFALRGSGAGGGSVPVGLSAARLGPVIGAVTLATAAITAMAAAYGGLAIGALRAANAQQSFERQTRAVFTGLAGGDKRIGDETFDLVDGLSKRLPVARQQLVDWTKALQESGINSRGVLRKGVIGLASAQAVGGEEGATTLLSTLRRVQEAVQTNHGLKLADRQLAQLAKTGANVKDVADELGISTATLQQRLKAGTQEAGAFGTALLTAVQKKGSGPLKAMWLDLDVLEKKAFEFGQRLFQNVDVTPLTDALDRAFHLLDQDTVAGSDMGKVITKSVNAIAKSFGGIVDGATVAYLSISTFVLKSDTELLKLENRIRGFGNLLKNLPGRLISFGQGNTSALEPPKTPNFLGVAKESLYTAAGAVARARVVGHVHGDELQKMADELGASIAAGVRNGIISHAEGVKLTTIALGKKAIEGFKTGAQVHSPSRATMAIGVHLGEGLVLGMRATAGHVSRAGRYLGEQATRASLYRGTGRDVRGEAFSRGGGGGKGGGTHIDHVDVSLTAPAGVTGAEELTAWGLAIALEREQMMGGA